MVRQTSRWYPGMPTCLARWWLPSNLEKCRRQDKEPLETDCFSNLQSATFRQKYLWETRCRQISEIFHKLFLRRARQYIKYFPVQGISRLALVIRSGFCRTIGI